MTLELIADHLQAITTHADRTYPDECCGLLIGRIEPEKKVLVEVRAVQNAWDAEVAEALADASAFTKARRYWIAPEELLAAMRDADRCGCAVIGIYHSHPDQPAVPSECDRRLAWLQYSYVIVSVQQGSSQECRSWMLDDQQIFQPEDILVVEALQR